MAKSNLEDGPGRIYLILLFQVTEILQRSQESHSNRESGGKSMKEDYLLAHSLVHVQLAFL